MLFISHLTVWINLFKMATFFLYFFHSILIKAIFDGSAQHMETRGNQFFFSLSLPLSLITDLFTFSCFVYLPSWPYLLLWTTSPQHHTCLPAEQPSELAIIHLSVLQIHSRCDAHFVEQTWFLNTCFYRNIYTQEQKHIHAHQIRRNPFLKLKWESGSDSIPQDCSDLWVELIG